MKKESITIKLVIVFVILTLGCCKQPNVLKHKVIGIKRTIEIPKQTYSKSGSFYESSMNTELLYFTEPVTLKNIKIFDTNGSFVDSVPLNQAISELDEIQSITILSLDTIIISSFISPKIVFLNRYGNCYKTINIEDILPDSLKSSYEYYPSITYNYLDNANCIFFRSWPNYHKILSENNMYTNSMNTNMYNYYKYFYESPFLFKLDVNGDSTNYNFGCYNIYKNICDNNYLFDEVPNFKILNNKVFIWSIYSNLLFEVDPNSLEIQNKINVNSEYTKTYTDPIKIDTTNLEEQLKLQQDLNIYGGKIFNVFYNCLEKQYYLIIKHEVTNRNDSNSKKTFSIIIYNETFQKSKEYMMDETKYLYSSAIMLEEGLMFLTIDPKGSSKNNRTYEILDFN